jgi:hypothetical protein
MPAADMLAAIAACLAACQAAGENPAGGITGRPGAAGCAGTLALAGAAAGEAAAGAAAAAGGAGFGGGGSLAGGREEQDAHTAWSAAHQTINFINFITQAKVQAPCSCAAKQFLQVYGK